MTEAIEKAPDVAIDAMNATLRRMHKTPPTPHKSKVLQPDNKKQQKNGRERKKRNIGAIVWRGFQIFLGAAYLSGAFVGWFFIYKAGWVAEIGSSGIEYKDFISIILTALAIMIAILGAFIAVLAVYGSQGIKEEAIGEAARVARMTAKDVAVPVAEEVAAKAVAAHLEQMAPIIKGADYGVAAGQDKNGE